MESSVEAIVARQLKIMLRQSSSYSYGAVSKPTSDDSIWQPQRGVRAAPVDRVMVMRDSFEHDVMSAYNSMVDGQVKLLCAGTGVGKTTKLPHMISKSIGGNGLILMPDNLLVMRTQPYVQQMITEQLNSSVTAVILRSGHILTPITGVVLYYSSAADFLAKFSQSPSMLDMLGIKYIYLDEAHENRPDYYFMRILVTMNLFPKVKMFYGSATATRDFSLEGGGAGRETVSVGEFEIPLGRPFDTPNNSPAHFSKIGRRTMFFLPDDEEIDLWQHYYTTHDLIVYVYGHRSSSKELHAIANKVSESRVCVFLVTSVLETGHTFDIDAVIVSGKKQILTYDLEAPAVVLSRRNLTNSERTQQIGRVGRHRRGTAYYVNNKLAPDIPELTPETAIYVYLWSALFGITIKTPDIAMYADLFGELKSSAISLFLNSRVSPLLLIPYVGSVGFYNGWGTILKSALYSQEYISDNTSNADAIANWPLRVMSPIAEVDYSGEYKCKVAFPDLWELIPFYLWKAFSAEFSVLHDSSDTRSVISGISDAVSGKKGVHMPIRQKRDESPAMPTKPVYARKTSESSVDSLDRSYKPPKYEDVDDVMSQRMTFDPSAFAHVRFQKPPVSPVPEENDENIGYAGNRQSLQEWMQDIPKSSKRDSHSSSSHSSDSLVLIRKDPVKYKNHKLYPMDQRILSLYIASERETERDQSKFKKLMSGARNLYSLHSDEEARKSIQVEYFLSVLRVHNAAVVAKLQIAANAGSPTGWKKFFQDSTTSRIEDNSTTVLATAKLLLAFQAENYFVGVDKRTLSVGSLVSFDDFSLELDESKAYYALACGPVIVASIKIPQIINSAKPFYRNGHLLANAFLFGKYTITVAHAYKSDDGLSAAAQLGPIHYIDENDDVVIFDNNLFTEHTFAMKQPKPGQDVYIVAANRSKKVIVLGVYTVYGADDVWLVDKILGHGYSGSMLVAVDDGAIVGMYVGKTDNFGMPNFSRFTPADKFATKLM